MSLLLSCQSIRKAYGTTPLFDELSFGLFEGDRVGLVGPNGRYPGEGIAACPCDSDRRIVDIATL